MIPLALLWRYFRTRKLHFTDREALENWQAKRLHQFRQNVLSHSPWFQRYLTLPFNQWPMMDKALMMTHFDEMNTAGLKRDELLDCAMRSEQSRDFKPCVGRFSVGLSSGTSGRRGLFVVSPHEQQMWAAGVLAKVMAGELTLKVKKVISVAEVLEPQDRELLRNVFHNVGEIYQATEGFLASTCRCGTLHLNEEFVHIEPQWLDEHRFVPIVTDFTRTTQPIVRYRLDDVLVASEQPCSCGSATMAIARIEGRQDDQLQLPTRSGDIQTVFADACSRVLAMTLPLTVDYRLLQTGSAQLTLIADCELWMLEHCREALNALFIRQDIAVGQLIWSLEPQTVPVSFTAKRRRIVRQWGRE